MLSYRYSYIVEKLDNLKILACDYTEEDLFDYRKQQQQEFENLKKYSTYRDNQSPLKKIGFLARDFTVLRPSGQLCQSFFKHLSNYRKYFEIHFFTTYNDKIDDEYNQYGIIHQNHIQQLADTIHNIQIDILFDMQGCMVNNFISLLKYKPAPIQVHFIGYPGTLGISHMDYLIADRVIIPETSMKYYCENIAYMPNCYQINNEKYLVQYSTFNLKSLSIPKESFIMCCVNTTYKINRSTILFWLGLLKKIKHGIFVIVINNNSHFENNIMEDAKELHVSNQVRIVPQLPKKQHINRIASFHLNLDTIILNGHTSTSDCVAAGIPTVTLCGDTFHNRVGKSILTCLGLHQLVANTIQEYEDIVIKLAKNKMYYQHIKNILMKNRTKRLYNSSLYTSDFVRLMYSMWNKSIQKTEDFIIPQLYISNDREHIKPVKCSPYDIILHNSYVNNEEEWVFHPGKTCNGDTIANVSLSGEKLYKLASTTKLCTAFTTSGKLFKTPCEIINSTEVGSGIYIKKKN